MRIIITLVLIFMAMKLDAQTIVPLYPSQIPNSLQVPDEEVKNVNAAGQIRYGRVSRPSLEICLPPKEKASGAAVIICPGGAYSIVSYTHEGTNVAAEFNKIGVAAFILKYRIPSDKTMADRTIGALQDAQAAIKMVRQHAAEWNIDTARVGMVGFSAGGHLASAAGTHFDKAFIENKEGVNLRPDFMILLYPVIDLAEFLSPQSTGYNLLGPNPSAELVKLYSSQLHVSARTPPSLLVHAGDDRSVSVSNSIRFYEALQKNGVPAELYIYAHGGHGFGVTNKTTPDRWMDRVNSWMKSNNWIK